MADSQNDDPGGYGLDDSERSSGGSASGSSVGGKGGGGGGGEPIPRDDFVRKLVRDPARVHEEERLLLLSGFIGDSDQEGYTRIYCEPTLDCFADVRDEDIVHHQESDGGGPGRMVWARFGAQVRQGRRGQGKRPESSFLAGPLMQDYGGGGAGSGGPPGAAQAFGGGGGAPAEAVGARTQFCIVPTVLCPTFHCPRTWWICPVQTTICPIQTTICPIVTINCPTGICPVSLACGPQLPIGGGVGPIAAQGAGGGAQFQGAAAPGGEMMFAAHGGGGGAAAQSTAATLCTQIGCYTHVCTQFCTVGCPVYPTYAYGCTLGFTCTYVSCGTPPM